ncbi:MAG: hypothetical protein COB17_07300 [Sulfurimonas sp.]|nr:MAG: hypothetical protein COB17_07300 [Sulfurimonas sp.]
MIYKSKIGDINLSKITRLYPAGIVNIDGEIAEMSLEWCEMNTDKVNITHYVLVFDFTAPKEEIRDKKELKFDTREELVVTMTEVAKFFQD